MSDKWLSIVWSIIAMCSAGVLIVLIIFTSHAASVDSGHTKGQILACSHMRPNLQGDCLDNIIGGHGG